MVGRKKKTKGSAPYIGRVFILNDNVSREATEALGGENSVIHTAETLGFSSDVDDETMVAKFSSVAAQAESTAIVVTADRGKGDRVMPETMKKYPGILYLINSVKGKDDQIKASLKLKTISGFKNLATYPKQYKKLHLQKSGSTLRVDYTTRKNKRKTEDRKGLFG